MAMDTRILEVVIRARDETQKAMNKLGGNLSSLQKIGAGGAALTGFGIAMAAGLNKAADAAAGYGKEVVTVQRLTGGTAKDSSILAAILGRMGVEGSKAGLIFKSLATNINKNSPELKAMGVATKDATGKNREMGAVLRDVAQYYATSTDKTGALANVSKVLGRGYMTLLPLLAGGGAAFDKMAKGAEAAGLVLSQKQIDDVKAYGAASKDAEQAIKGLEVQFGLLILPIKTFMANYASKFFRWLNTMSPEAKKLATTVALVATAFALIAGPIMMLVGFLPQIAAGFGIIGGALSGISLPVVAVVAVLAAAALLIMKYWAPIKEFFLKIWAAVKPIFDWFITTVGGALTAAFDNLKQAWADIAPMLEPLMPILKLVGITLIGMLVVPLGIVVLAVVAVLVILAKLVQGFTWLVKTVVGGYKNIPATWAKIGPFFSNLWAKAKAVFATAWAAIKKTVSSGITAAINFIKKLPGQALAALKAFGSFLVRPFVDAWNRVKTAVRNGVNAVIEFVRGLPQRMWDALKNLAATIWGPISKVIALMDRLNPFHRSSPSLVDNVLAGTAAIAAAYSGISGIRITPPTIGNLRGPAFAFGGGSGSSGTGTINRPADQSFKVYLDGRELTRAVGRVTVHNDRSGAR